MTGLFLTLVNRSLAAGWLILAIILLRPFLRRVSRSICCALWGLVAFRLLCPFSIKSVLSLIPSTTSIPTDLTAPQPTVIEGGANAGTPVSSDFPPSIPSAVPSTAPATVSPMQTVLQIIVVMWITGVVLFALYAVLSYLRLRVRVQVSARQNGYWVCERIQTPFVLGFFRPRIYLPLYVNQRDISYILAHERAHIARRDHWRKAFAFALLSVFWFHPFMWIAFILLCRDIEFACDERALRALGTDAQSKKDYAEALVRGSFPSLPVLTCPLAFGGLQVKQRVLSVAKYRKPALSLVLAAVLVCGAVAVCFLTDPKVGAGALTDAPADGSVDAPELLPPEKEAPEEDAAKQPDQEAVSSWPKDAKPAEVIRTPIEPSVVAYANNEPPPWELETAFALCHRHFDLYPISGEESPSTVIMVTNDGEEDGSVTYLVLDETCSYGVEILTILLPAGEKTVYDFGRIAGYVSIGASYNGASAMLPLRPYVTG